MRTLSVGRGFGTCVSNQYRRTGVFPGRYEIGNYHACRILLYNRRTGIPTAIGQNVRWIFTYTKVYGRCCSVVEQKNHSRVIAVDKYGIILC